MAESRPVPNPDLLALGPKLDKPGRDKLNELGLIESARSGGRFVHELTDRGWHLCREIVSAGAPPRSTGPAKTLYTVLAALDRYLDSRRPQPRRRVRVPERRANRGDRRGPHPRRLRHAHAPARRVGQPRPPARRAGRRAARRHRRRSAHALPTLGSEPDSAKRTKRRSPTRTATPPSPSAVRASTSSRSRPDARGTTGSARIAAAHLGPHRRRSVATAGRDSRQGAQRVCRRRRHGGVRRRRP